MVSTSTNCKATKKKVQQNQMVSKRQIACEMGISDQSVRQMAKTKLGLKPYKFQKVTLNLKKNSCSSKDAENFWDMPPVSTGRDSFLLMRSSLPSNKLTTPRIIRPLQVPWQLLNIAKIQSWS